MRTIEVNVYKFAELSANAKERAKQDYQSIDAYPDADAAIGSLKALAIKFGGKVTNYSIDWGNGSPSYCKFDMPTLPRDEIEEILAGLGTFDPDTFKGLGDCKLTGWDFDEDALDAFRKDFLTSPTTDLQALMQAAFRNWLKSCQNDYESFYEDENFSEHADANDMEFYQDGEIL